MCIREGERERERLIEAASRRETKSESDVN